MHSFYGDTNIKRKSHKGKYLLAGLGVIAVCSVLMKENLIDFVGKKMLKLIGMRKGDVYECLNFEYYDHKIHMDNFVFKSGEDSRFFKADVSINSIDVVLSEGILKNFLFNKYRRHDQEERILLIEKVEVADVNGVIELCETNPNKFVLPILVKGICIIDAKIDYTDSRKIQSGKLVDKSRRVVFPNIVLKSLNTANYFHRDPPKKQLDQMLFETNGYGLIGDHSWFIRNIRDDTQLLQSEIQLFNLPLQAFAGYLVFPLSELNGSLDFEFTGSLNEWTELIDSVSKISVHDIAMNERDKTQKKSVISNVMHTAMQISTYNLKGQSYSIFLPFSFKEKQFNMREYLTFAFIEILMIVKETKLFKEKEQKQKLEEERLDLQEDEELD